ncbi:PD40 domain-containing protein [Kitasatospora sp. NPDC048540]|uniref:TolB family protein n=1 Tax=unclassified Kitasatospora TaxID=2633591 RepID=UPI00053A4683|nr:PD40 domain-containing protein [Kitasatospora sp. MBT63]
MSARTRMRNRSAVAIALAVTAGVALLTGCDPEPAGSAAPGASASATAAARPASPSVASTATAPAPVTPTAKPSASASASKPAGATPTGTAAAANGTAGNGLTISNGTQYVLMNGGQVDFGTAVRDLAWSPDGSKAAFVSGSGDLVVSNPDGSGRVVVAKNPGGQTWSHPTWQVAPAEDQYRIPAKNNIIFAAVKDGVSRLERVAATAQGGTPEQIALNTMSDPDVKPLPATGNTWPSGGGKVGAAVYANSDTGEVYIRDEYLRQQGSSLGKGSQPAMSPDGEEIVFVRSVGGHDHVFEVDHTGKDAKDLTPNATTDYTEPAFSPDGRTIAVRTPGGIATLPAHGGAAPVQVSTSAGLPAYRAGKH